MEKFLVGGALRDRLLGVDSHDYDFVVLTPSFEAMRDGLVEEGFRIWQERPEYVTIRAGVPDGHPLREFTRDADFVMARKDGPSSDGRRPDFVEPGTLLDDLARRDFTVNALAMSEDGEFHDPFNGRADIESRTLRFVGDPERRISEDGLRVLRGFRFMITKGFEASPLTYEALVSPLAIQMLGCVSIERIRDELVKMFDADELQTFRLMNDVMPPAMINAIFRDGLWLQVTPTLKAR